jgi:hypothetical protein
MRPTTDTFDGLPRANAFVIANCPTVPASPTPKSSASVPAPAAAA